MHACDIVEDDYLEKDELEKMEECIINLGGPHSIVMMRILIVTMMMMLIILVIVGARRVLRIMCMMETPLPKGIVTMRDDVP